MVNTGRSQPPKPHGPMETRARLHRKMLMIWYLEYFFPSRTGRQAGRDVFLGLGVSKFLQSMANIYLMLHSGQPIARLASRGVGNTTCLLSVVGVGPPVFETAPLFRSWQHCCCCYCCLVNFWSSTAERLLFGKQTIEYHREKKPRITRWLFYNERICLRNCLIAFQN